MNLREQIQSLLPDARVFARDDGQLNDAELSDFGVDRTSRYADKSQFDLLVQPASTAEILNLVRFAREKKIALVPSGGRTGLSGGAVAARGEVVVSLTRMNKVLEFYPGLPALRVEAGMITATLQNEARERGFFFPVDFASSGSSCVGGNIATNAGGVRVIRYGNMREQVLGLKVVTGAGDLLEFSGELLKNNSGYDLKHLLIGSEGTLGFITEATLRLTAPPGDSTLVLFALDSFARVTALLEAVREYRLGLLAFECLDRLCLETVRTHLDLPDPFTAPAPYYVLMEFESDGAGDRAFERLLEERLYKDEMIQDAMLAEGSAGRRRVWSYREGISESLGAEYTVHKNDISLPPAGLEPFLSEHAAFLNSKGAGIRPAVFGHIGDGNLHLNLVKPAAMSPDQFFARCDELDHETYALIQKHGGSISAEHGIGLLKKTHLHFTRSPAEIRLMREIKKSFDPDGILNPGKVLPDPAGDAE